MNFVEYELNIRMMRLNHQINLNLIGYWRRKESTAPTQSVAHVVTKSASIRVNWHKFEWIQQSEKWTLLKILFQIEWSTKKIQIKFNFS